MRRQGGLGWLVMVVLVVAAVVAALLAGVAVGTVINAGMVVLVLVWLGVVLVVPWNVHLHAARVLEQMAESRARGLVVPDEQAFEAAAMKRRMLRVSVGLHVFSAAGLAVGAWVASWPQGWVFCALYLLATAVRPALAWFIHLRQRLTTLEQRVRFPRNDVLAVMTEMQQLKDRVEHLRGEQVRTYKETKETLAGQQRGLAGVEQRTHGLEQRLEQVHRSFESTVDRLGDNHEVMRGLKAFLRMVRAPA